MTTQIIKPTLEKIVRTTKIIGKGIALTTAIGLGVTIMTYTYGGPSSYREKTIEGCVVTRSYPGKINTWRTEWGETVETVVPSYFKFKMPSGKTGLVRGEYFPTGTTITVSSKTEVFGGWPEAIGLKKWPKYNGFTEYSIKYGETK